MRYPDGGGLTAAGRSKRAAVRLQAAALLDAGVPVAQIAAQLRVSAESVYRWRRRWSAGGRQALASRGSSGSACRLDDQQLQQLAAALDQGPAVHRFGRDQRWTLARVAELIERMFGVSYTLRGTSYLLHRLGFTPQVPARRAAERDPGDRRVALQAVAVGKRLAAARGAWICFEDEAGQTLRPPKTRTWARRGQTPTVTVSGKGSGRVSIAGLVCLKEGHRGRLIYRTITHRGRTGERRSFAETDYIALLDAAHTRLNAPIVVIWDNLNVHTSAAMRALIDARDWLTVIRLPAYAPDLNPIEGVWSHLKRGIGNLAVHGIDHLVITVRHCLSHIQRHPDLIAGFLVQTGMTLVGGHAVCA